MSADASKIEALIEQGIAHHQAGRVVEARAAYSQALSEDPNNAEVLSLLGLIERGEGRLEAAVEFLGRATAADPTWWSYANDLGEALFQLGRLPESEGALRRAAELNGEAFQPHFLLGLVLNKQGRWAEAAGELEKAVGIAGSPAEAWQALGMALMGSQRLDQAERAQRRAIELNGEFPEAERSLAMVLAMTGRTDESIGHLENAIRMRPNDAAILGSFAEVRFKRGEHEAAIHLLERAVELEPRSLPLQWALARECFTEKRWAKAIEALKRCLGLEERAPMAHYLMGRAREALGDAEGAGVNMRRAVELGLDLERGATFAATLQDGTVPKLPTDAVSELFDRFAEKFDKELLGDLDYQGHKMIEHAVTAAMGGRPKELLDVLDVGCGTGLVGMLMKPLARRLVGVDLAPKMIEKSRERGIYDELIAGDAAAVIARRPNSADLITAGDVLIYIGQAEEIFQAVDRALRPGGMFSFTIETKGGDGLRLMPSERYQHSLAYVRRLAKGHRWEELHCSQHVLRNEAQRGVEAHVLVFRKPPVA